MFLKFRSLYINVSFYCVRLLCPKYVILCLICLSVRNSLINWFTIFICFISACKNCFDTLNSCLNMYQTCFLRHRNVIKRQKKEIILLKRTLLDHENFIFKFMMWKSLILFCKLLQFTLFWKPSVYFNVGYAC